VTPESIRDMAARHGINATDEGIDDVAPPPSADDVKDIDLARHIERARESYRTPEQPPRPCEACEHRQADGVCACMDRRVDRNGTCSEFKSRAAAQRPIEEELAAIAAEVPREEWASVADPGDHPIQRESSIAPAAREAMEMVVQYMRSCGQSIPAEATCRHQAERAIRLAVNSATAEKDAEIERLRAKLANAETMSNAVELTRRDERAERDRLKAELAEARKAALMEVAEFAERMAKRHGAWAKQGARPGVEQHVGAQAALSLMSKESRRMAEADNAGVNHRPPWLQRMVDSAGAAEAETPPRPFRTDPT